MAAGDFDDTADAQDRAETLDETNLTTDGVDIANFNDLVDVFNATAAEDDGDTEDLDEERDEEDFDDDEVEMITQSNDERDDTGLSSESDGLTASAKSGDERGATGGEPRSFESGDLSDKEVEALGYDDHRKPPEHDPHTEKQLDHGLKETFPASDPVSINPGAD